MDEAVMISRTDITVSNDQVRADGEIHESLILASSTRAAAGNEPKSAGATHVAPSEQAFPLVCQ